MRTKHFMAWALIGLLALPGLALAHTPLFSCFDNADGTICCEGGFSDGSSEKQAAIQAPHSSLEVLGIGANAQGECTIGLPKAGWWGIAVLGVGSEDEYKGKGLAQEPVLWIQVTDMP